VDDPGHEHKTGAVAVNRFIVYPGETVSFNTMTGERTEAKEIPESPQTEKDKTWIRRWERIWPAPPPSITGAADGLRSTSETSLLAASFFKEGFDAAVNGRYRFCVHQQHKGVNFIRAACSR
jgi:hypothetical protein